MNPQELDEVYTKLGYALTEVGEERTPMVLARLVLLLMRETGDAQAVSRAIDAAVEGAEGALGACVVREMRALKFPKSSAETKVSVPFVFQR